MFALWATGTDINDLVSSPSQHQRHTSATLPSGYAPGFLSISITIRLTSWENFGSGSRSFGRCPGSYGAVRVGNVAFGSRSTHLYNSTFNLQLPCGDTLTSIEVVGRVTSFRLLPYLAGNRVAEKYPERPWYLLTQECENLSQKWRELS